MRLIDADVLAEELKQRVEQADKHSRYWWKRLLTRVDAQATVTEIPDPEEVFDKEYDTLDSAYEAVRKKAVLNWRIEAVGSKYRLQQIFR